MEPRGCNLVVGGMDVKTVGPDNSLRLVVTVA